MSSSGGRMTVTEAPGRNWAGNHAYAAERLERPGTVEQLQAVVAAAARVRALGSRHSFTDIADTAGVLVSLAAIPPELVLDEAARTVTVGAGTGYGVLATALQGHGWALPNLASLPHISIGGALATGTHGSGDACGTLAESVAALDVVGPDGELRRVRRSDADFDGSVVALGALGVVSRVTLDLEPTYDVRQDLFLGLDWSTLADQFDAVTGSAYSVSLVTDWLGGQVGQVWLKSRVGEDRAASSRDFFGASPAPVPTMMLSAGEGAAHTTQGGVPGPWLDRLPHFRMDATPSSGAELQSEYLLPRAAALDAVDRLRSLGALMAPILQSSEIRTMRADRQWLSGAHGRDTVGFHFTWQRRPDDVYAVLPRIEDALLPLGARPHWGKCFVAEAERLEALYPAYGDFRALRARVDPQGVFGNAFLDRVLGT